MRVLQISPQSPGTHSGGELGVRQTLLSLLENGCEVDYIGPVIEEPDLFGAYAHVYTLEPSDNVPLRIYDTLHGHTNKRYRSFLALDFDPDSYDLIVMDFTKLDYVLDRVSPERVIVRVHNVEADYSERNHERQRTLISCLDRHFAVKREERIVKEAGKLIVLTGNDRQRLRELYSVPDEKMTTVPVCVEDPRPDIQPAADDATVKMIITGSLWYGPNCDGIIWFLREVYSRLDFEAQLIIAGARPSPKLKKAVSGYPGVSIVDTPPAMRTYFESADLSVAPVFDGAGMKVKVAEALSFGLPVLGTRHAFEGYDITHGENSFLSDSPEEFLGCVRKFHDMSTKERVKLKKNSYALYQAKYSMQKSSELFGDILRDIVAE